MHRTDAPGHVANLHVDANPPTAGTTVAAATMNALQEELAGVVEAMGIALVKGTNTQVLAALRALFADGRPSISAAVASNALTVSIKTLVAGADATAGTPIRFSFIDPASASNSVPVVRSLTAASSIVISSGSTLGTGNGVPFRLWLVMFDDAGVLRPALINPKSPTGIYPLGQFPSASATAEGGAGAADSAQVFYAGAAIATKAYVVIGYLEWAAGLATAGLWTAAPTTIRLLTAQTPLPVHEMLAQRNVWTQAQDVAQVVLTDAASIATDASLSNAFLVTLGGNRTLANPTNLVAGQTIAWAIRQDATGNRTLAFGAMFTFPAGADKLLSTGANAKDLLTGYYDGAVLLCSLQKAFG